MPNIDRINRVINTKAFINSLDKNGIDLMEFQLNWPKYGPLLGDLPMSYQHAIMAGEVEKFGGGCEDDF